MWLMWETNLGNLRANLVRGPKTKFVVLLILYKFHYGAMTIRALQQCLINTQVDNFSELTAIKGNEQNLVKPKSNLIQVFVCYSPKHKLQLL
jgi:hypothetical protein